MYEPMWPFLLMYWSHDMRHTSFPQVDGGQRDPRGSGRHSLFKRHFQCKLKIFKIMKVSLQKTLSTK